MSKHIITLCGTEVEIDDEPQANLTTPEPIARAIEMGMLIALALTFTIGAIAFDWQAITDRLHDALYYVERV